MDPMGNEFELYTWNRFNCEYVNMPFSSGDPQIVKIFPARMEDIWRYISFTKVSPFGGSMIHLEKQQLKSQTNNLPQYNPKIDVVCCGVHTQYNPKIVVFIPYITRKQNTKLFYSWSNTHRGPYTNCQPKQCTVFFLEIPQKLDINRIAWSPQKNADI